MICRDNRKELAYFVRYISDQEKRIQRFEDVRAQLYDEKRLKECNMILSNLQRDMFCAKFSAGYSKEDLIIVFNAYIDQMLLDASITYDELANAIAINIFLDADRKKDLITISSGEKKDALIDKLLEKSIDNDQLNESIYRPFYDFLNDDITTDEFLNYIKYEWYNSCKDLNWFDTLNSNNDVYTGYWCWLAAAILKLKGETADNQYIPKI